MWALTMRRSEAVRLRPVTRAAPRVSPRVPKGLTAAGQIGLDRGYGEAHRI